MHKKPRNGVKRRNPSLLRHSGVVFLLAALFFLPHCSTFYKALRIDGVDAAYGLVRKTVIRSMPVGMRLSSSNGREIYSQYFIPERRGYKEAIGKDVRFYAKVVILGSRRPYDLEIYVFRQRRKKIRGRVEYDIVGQDLRLANRLKKEIRTRLAQRRDDMNIIDDFRVF